MSLLTSLNIQFRSWWPVAAMALFGPFCAPFSRRWRYRLAGSREAWTNPFLIAQAELGEFLDESLGLTLPGIAARVHNVSEAELLAVTALAAQCRCRRVFEIGTFDGRTTRCLALNLPVDGHVFTLNLPPDTMEGQLKLDTVDLGLARKVVSGERFHGTPEAARITQLWGDSASFDFSPYLGTLDMVFIDGAHSENYVANDTRNAVRLLRSAGGLLVWHDATLFGVARFLEKWIAAERIPFRLIKGTTVGVTAREGGRFVDPIQFCKKQPTAGAA